MRIGTDGVFMGYEDEAQLDFHILRRGDPCVVFDQPDDDTLRVCLRTVDGELVWELTELIFRSEFLPIRHAPLVAEAIRKSRSNQK